jgi:hypothetical protein
VPKIDPLARVSAFEQKLASAESDAQWDALEPELRELERDLHSAVHTHELELSRAEEAFGQAHGALGRYNPFDTSARADYRAKVEPIARELELRRGDAYRLHELSTRFYEDRTRKQAREFIRIAEKVQRAVVGTWEAKADAAAAAWLMGRSGEETIAAVDAARLASSSADDSALLASILGVEATVGPGLSLVERAAAIVERPRDEARDFAEAVDRAIGDDGGAIAAAGIIAERSIEETVSVARDVLDQVNGTPDAQRIIAAAAVLSMRTAEEAIAFAKHVQSALSGTWETEATVIAAGLLSRPGKMASATVRRAFLLPGLFRAGDGSAV